jgi:hypothetical protein
MKKIIISILIFIFIIPYSYSYMLPFPKNSIIWKISEVKWDFFSFENYINVKTPKWFYFDFLNERNIFFNKNEIEKSSFFIQRKNEDIKLNKWDIVFISGDIIDWVDSVDIISKVTCKEWIFEINWKVDDFSKKLDEYIWCSNLNTFFEKDRSFEDLEWNNYFIYYLYWLFIKYLLFIILWVLCYILYINKNNKKWKKQIKYF